MNLPGDNIPITKKTKRTSIAASKEVGLEVNSEKTKYMFLSRHENVLQNHNIRTANRTFENVAQFKYLGYRSKKPKFYSEGNKEEIEFV
jgi:hypothetical protein